MNKTSLWRYYLDAFRLRYFDFTGRARRREYWGFVLFDSIVSLVLLILGFLIFFPSELGEAGDPIGGLINLMMSTFLICSLAMVYGLLTLPARMAIAVRRLHDTGRSGWWIFGYYLWSAIGTTILNMVALRSSSIGTIETIQLISSLISLVGAVTILIFLLRDSSREVNAWGESPKYHHREEENSAQ